MKISSSTSRPLSRSITQSITGRPATLSIGLGIRCVCGRRRVPLPASGMMTCMSSASPVAVGDAHQVVEFRGRRLEHIAVDHRFDLVNRRGRNVHRIAGAEGALYRRAVADRPGAEDEFAGEYVHRLVLLVVILDRQQVPRLYVEDLADIAIPVRPDQFGAPGLLD